MIFCCIIDGLIAVALLGLVLSDIDKDGYRSTKGWLFVAAGIKLFIKIPLYIITYRLWLARKMNSNFYIGYAAILTLIYLPWSIYCMIHFFDHSHELKHHSVQMYIGMLFLWIEGFMVMSVVSLMLIIAGLIVFYYMTQTSLENEQTRSSTRMRRIIEKLDILKLTGNNFESESICCICTETIQNAECIILACNSNHKFHKVWIANWVKTYPACPVCRTMINDDDLSQLKSKVDELQAQRTYGSSRYAFLCKLNIFIAECCTNFYI